MNEEQLYAIIGRKQAEIEDRNACFNKLFQLFGAVISGDLDPSRVLVNLTERTYLIAPAGQRPAMPATINGLPVCIVAPQPAAPIVAEAVADISSEEQSA